MTCCFDLKEGIIEKGTALRICIDIRALETGGKFRGYGYYIKNLVSNVIRLDNFHDYSFIVYDKSNPMYQEIRTGGSKVFEFRKPSIRPRFWWVLDQLYLPKLIKKINPDVFISLDANLPFSATLSNKFKTVVAVHDLIPLVLQDEYRLPLDRKIDFNLKMLSARRSDGVLTISKFSLHDIVTHLKIPLKRVKYIYESTDETFSPAGEEEASALREKYASGQKYIMTVGHYYGQDPRKNYLFLLEAFAKLIGSEDRANLRLLFVGQSGGQENEYSRIVARAKDLDVLDRVSFTDFVTDKELAGLYSGAEAFVYPTKYEGFGLPILQAMGCGCPVVAARNTSIPEVMGSAGELFKTNNEDSFVKALQKVLSKNKNYHGMGLENVKRFSWESSAKEFIEYINSFKK